MKKIALSFLMFVGAVYAFDEASAAADLLGHPRNEKDFVEIDFSPVAETAKAVTEKATHLVSGVVAKFKANDQKAPVIEVQPVVMHTPVAPVTPEVAPMIESTAPAHVVEEVSTAAGSTPDLSSPEVSATPVIKVVENLAHDVPVALDTPEQSVALANVYVQFAREMFNPYAHARAYSAMWNAGYKDAFSTLWADHKPVVAGTAVITAILVTALYYARKNGWFEKAKVWALDMQQASSAYVQGMFS
jgi:uncharacterized membrane protein (DUF485 family)